LIESGFFTLAANDRGYGHLAVFVALNVPFARALAVVGRQGELKISEANAGTNTAKFMSASR